MSIGSICGSLKDRLCENSTLKVQHAGGELYMTYFSWRQPANKDKINNLQENSGWRLPRDFIEFLLVSDGASLFCNKMDESRVELYSVNEINEYYEDYAKGDGYLRTYPPEWVMIGEYSGYGEYFFIDSKKVKDGENRCMINVSVGNIISMEIDFTTWLDRLIVAQGERFWLWNESKYIDI